MKQTCKFGTTAAFVLTLVVSVPVSARVQTGAYAGKWGVGLSAGPSINLSNLASDVTRTGFGFSGSLTLKEMLDVEMILGGRFAKAASHLDVATGLHLRLTWGRLQVVAGPRVGVTVMRVHWDFGGNLWTWAMMFNLGAGLRVWLLRGLEVRVRLTSLSLYWNEVTVVCWEPSLGAGFRF